MSIVSYSIITVDISQYWFSIDRVPSANRTIEKKEKKEILSASGFIHLNSERPMPKNRLNEVLILPGEHTCIECSFVGRQKSIRNVFHCQKHLFKREIIVTQNVKNGRLICSSISN